MKDHFAALRESGDIAGDHDGNIRFHGERFNIMGADYFMADFYQSLADIYGEGAGGILKTTGEGYGEDLVALTATSDDTDAAFGQLLGFLAFLGYSTPTVHEDRVVFPDTPTAAEHRKTNSSPQQVCYFLAGILTGSLQKLGIDKQFVETACRGNGADRCAFELHD